VRVVADSHALIWFGLGSPRLSTVAHDVLAGAEADGGIVVSTATLIDLWYVTETTEAIGRAELAALRQNLLSSPAVALHPIGIDVADAYVSIDRQILRDPWDRLIVATAIALGLPLVTKDAAIQRSRLVPTVW
jgi:PIN domain nuclease of toxin-antitoxin system